MGERDQRESSFQKAAGHGALATSRGVRGPAGVPRSRRVCTRADRSNSGSGSPEAPGGGGGLGAGDPSSLHTPGPKSPESRVVVWRGVLTPLMDSWEIPGELSNEDWTVKQ